MTLFSLAVALLAALAIIGLGLGYLARPGAMVASFGMRPTLRLVTAPSAAAKRLGESP